MTYNKNNEETSNIAAEITDTNEQHKKIIDAEEVANILGVSKVTVYRYVNDGRITPINFEDWQIDQRYEFDINDVIKFKDSLEKKDGLTTFEAAERIGCNVQTILKNIREGNIKAEKRKYKGLMRNFISEEEVERFKKVYAHTQQTHFIKDKKCYLLQPYKKVIKDNNGNVIGTGELARIMHLDERGEGAAWTETEQQKDLKELLNNYRPVTEMVIKKRNNKKGYAVLRLPKPAQVKSSIYNTIDYIQSEVGINNIKISLESKDENEYILLEVKPTFLPLSMEKDRDIIDCISSHIVSGKVIVRDTEIYLDSDLEPIQTYVSSKTKENLEEQAKNRGIHLNELVREILENEGK